MKHFPENIRRNSKAVPIPKDAIWIKMIRPSRWRIGLNPPGKFDTAEQLQLQNEYQKSIFVACEVPFSRFILSPKGIRPQKVKLPILS